MINRISSVVAAIAAWVVLVPSVAEAQSFDYSFTVNVVSGPLAGGQYEGIVSVEADRPLLDETVDTVPSLLAIRFELGGVEFTEVQDSQDVDAQSPRANFEDGEFLGLTYIVSRFGKNPTDIPLINDVTVDGFAIDNSEFGYVVGADLYRGIVDYSLPPSLNRPNLDGPNPQSVPEPAMWFGFAAIGCSCLTRYIG